MTETSELSGDQLRKIVRDAMSLRERAGRRPPLSSPSMAEQNDSRLQAWMAAVAEGDREIFERRLAMDGLDLQTAKTLLCDSAPPSGDAPPPWAGVLNEVIRKMREPAFLLPGPELGRKFPYLKQDAPVAFEELLIPFVETARARLRSVASGILPALSEKAMASLERSLLHMLSEIGSRVFLVEFRTFLACQQAWGPRDACPSPGNDSRREYLSFIEDISRTGLGVLFTEYCVLARLLATALLQWVEVSGEFLERLGSDLPVLRTAFFGSRETGSVVALQTDRSDPHNGGRTVVIVEFDSGAKVVYKPKSMRLERRYFEFVDRLNGFGRTLPLRSLKILDRGGYGWMEYVDNTGCGSGDEVRRYYRRTGLFLCLVYVLNGIDFHFENLVACGEHPVPVDLETLFHHTAEDAPVSPDLTDATARHLRDSVLRTHLLPNPVKLHGRYFDISGIARTPEEDPDLELLAWENVNTDLMDYRYRKVIPRPADNLPKLEGHNPDPYDFVDEIEGGFREMYALLSELREELLAEDGLLFPVFRQEARFIFRATTVYLSILKGATSPDSLRDGRDFSIRLEVLARRLFKPKGTESPRLWPLVREEHDALWALDVPRFAAPGDRNSLLLKSGEMVRDCFPESAWELARKKIRMLGETDLNWQVSLIHGSMAAADAGRVTHRAAETEPGDGDIADTLLSREELLARALGEAGEIEKAIVFPEEPEPGWLVLEYLPDADQFALRSIKYDLYSGRCGIALFLAALEKTLPGSGWRPMVYSTLGPVRRMLEQAGTGEEKSPGLGGCAGLPSMAYALVRIGVFLEDAGLLEEAERTLLRITQKQIEADTALDVIGGSAGTILCLLACYGVTGAGEILEKAIACGRHLVKTARPDKSGFTTWPTLGKRHLTGFSHGAAGIAYSLLRLYRETGEREFYNAAGGGINFEKHEFSPERNNWPDHREFKGKDTAPADPVYMRAWCHGAPGIGLARLGALDAMDTPGIREDIRSALLTTRCGGPLPRDHLCCGNAGLAETLLTAGIKLQDPAWKREAVRIMSQIAARAELRRFTAVTVGKGFFNPGLFQGAAGVGYQLLRTACPDIIPSVLLLE